MVRRFVKGAVYAAVVTAVVLAVLSAVTRGPWWLGATAVVAVGSAVTLWQMSRPLGRAVGGRPSSEADLEVNYESFSSGGGPDRQRPLPYGPAPEDLTRWGAADPGAAPPGPMRDPWQSLAETARRTWKIGAVGIGGPDRLQLGEVGRVAVRITATRGAVERLREELAQSENVVVEAIQTSPVMRVTCSGDGFEVTPLAADDQALLDNGATWTFRVKALATGLRTVEVFVSLRIPGPDGSWVTRQTLRHPIQVSVSSLSAVRHFASKNATWLIGTLLGAAGTITAWIKLFA